jgi:hypothetical protein
VQEQAEGGDASWASWPSSVAKREERRKWREGRERKKEGRQKEKHTQLTRPYKILFIGQYGKRRTIHCICIHTLYYKMDAGIGDLFDFTETWPNVPNALNRLSLPCFCNQWRLLWNGFLKV